MTRERLYLFDTTLRDGALTTGVDFSLDDKLNVGGRARPGSGSTTWRAAIRARTPRHASSSPRSGRSARSSAPRHDQARRPLDRQRSRASRACSPRTRTRSSIVAKSWDYHVHVALGCTLDENLESIAESVRAAVDSGREAMVDLEHLRRLQGQPRIRARLRADRGTTPARGGRSCATPTAARCRTRSSGPWRRSARLIPGEKLGIHAHNDTGNAVANSLAAILAGARQVQGTLNGLGERCGNANLVTLIPTLALKDEIRGPLRDRRRRTKR